MDNSLFTPSLVVALLALWIGYENYKRSNYAIIRIRDCSCSYSHDVRENGGNTFGHFQVVIQNLGIPLHNLQMCLGFRGKDGSGRFNLPLEGGKRGAIREGVFAKGMITDFSFKSFQLDAGKLQFLSQLEDTARQAATLTLYADDYRVWEYRLDGFWVPAKRLWNRLAGKVNHRIRRQRGTNAAGVPIIKTYSPLPTFMLPSGRVIEFVEYVRKHAPGAMQ